MTLLRIFIALLIIVIFCNKTSYANEYDNFLKYFQKKCVNEPRNQILFLIDNTDPLKPEQQQFILDNFGKHEQRIKFAALINNKPSPVKMDYHGYEINKDEVPAWIVFPWEEWDK